MWPVECSIDLYQWDEHGLSVVHVLGCNGKDVSSLRVALDQNIAWKIYVSWYEFWLLI